MTQAFTALHADLQRGIPSIVCMHFDDKPASPEHFRLVVGFDADKDQVIFNDPAVKNGAEQRLPRDKFLELWPLKYSPRKWAIIRLRLDAGKLKEFEPAKTFTPADYCQHMMNLKKMMPKQGFSVVLSPPFVVIGDGGEQSVRGFSRDVVEWAVKQLKSLYFEKDPQEIIDIWLFKDKASYDKYTNEIFGDQPDTPFGYYSALHEALIMNIATGGGTLVHEIVHPFVRTNFPACPSWFNEGLGSLYEQSGSREGKIVGFTNWRLRFAQDAIKAGKLPSFETLTGTTSTEFYSGTNRATNYAQARYLCYYLQEKGLLVKFYQQFSANVKDDPTGYKTLKKVLGEDDMAAFQKKWEDYVSKLQFP